MTVTPRLRRVRSASASLLRQLSGLYQAVDMRVRRPAEMARAIRFSDLSIAAFAGERLIGFGRMISDRSYYGALWDIAVHPSQQGRGVGRLIVRRLLERARRRRLVIVGLFTAAENDRFYENLAFRKLAKIHAMTTSPTAFLDRKQKTRGAKANGQDRNHRR